MNIMLKSVSGAIWIALGALGLGSLLGLAGAIALKDHDHTPEPEGV